MPQVTLAHVISECRKEPAFFNMLLRDLDQALASKDWTMSDQEREFLRYLRKAVKWASDEVKSVGNWGPWPPVR